MEPGTKIEETQTDENRFYSAGRVRWNKGILEQEMYAFVSQTGEFLKYPEVKWIKVPEVKP